MRDMWEKGFSKEKGFYYWILKCNPITATRLCSTLCTYLGRVSTTKCINDKVNWLDSEYDFIIWGNDEESVNKAKKITESLFLIK